MKTNPSMTDIKPPEKCKACEVRGTGGLRHTCGIEPSPTILRFREEFMAFTIMGADGYWISCRGDSIEHFILQEIGTAREDYKKELREWAENKIQYKPYKSGDDTSDARVDNENNRLLQDIINLTK